MLSVLGSSRRLKRLETVRLCQLLVAALRSGDSRSNLAVDQRFANGTQGRLMHWHPAAMDSPRKALPASHPELQARFLKESSLHKHELLPEIDHLDIGARQENLAVSGEPVLHQLCVVPSYALTIHKTQSLSIRHKVYGCLEGVFAQGQVYVLWSRCTDPRNFHLVGVPPKDLVDDVAAAWAARGLDVDECFRKAVSVTNEWTYDPVNGLQQRRLSERTVPLKHLTLAETQNPQSKLMAVTDRFLDWIRRVDKASQTGATRPPFQTPDGEAIFLSLEERLWLTELKRTQEDGAHGDEDGLPSDDDEALAPDAPMSDEDPLSEPEPGSQAEQVAARAPFVCTNWTRRTGAGRPRCAEPSRAAG